MAYLAFTVPYRVGFREPAYGVWYIIDFFVDVYFWIDLLLNFFTAYWQGRCTIEILYPKP